MWLTNVLISKTCQQCGGDDYVCKLSTTKLQKISKKYKLITYSKFITVGRGKLFLMRWRREGFDINLHWSLASLLTCLLHVLCLLYFRTHFIGSTPVFFRINKCKINWGLIKYFIYFHGKPNKDRNKWKQLDYKHKRVTQQLQAFLSVADWH